MPSKEENIPIKFLPNPHSPNMKDGKISNGIGTHTYILDHEIVGGIYKMFIIISFFCYDFFFFKVSFVLHKEIFVCS
jgi:hypothetical protein